MQIYDYRYHCKLCKKTNGRTLWLIPVCVPDPLGEVLFVCVCVGGGGGGQEILTACSQCIFFSIFSKHLTGSQGEELIDQLLKLLAQ